MTRRSPASHGARSLAAAAVVLTLGASACGDRDAQSTSPNADLTTILYNGSFPPSTLVSPGERLVTTGLDAPWGLAFLPDGTALVSERDTGRVVALPAAGGEPVEVMRLPSETARDEGGLLGLAVSPDYATDEFVYAYYTSDDANQIVRFRLGEDLRGTDVEVVLDGLAAASTHNGGRIAFGPDGMLYAGVGDAANPSTSQNLDTLNGKILRMTPDGSVPADNPFPDSVVYSLGHRNVQGLAWDSDGRMWATEFGQNTYDEINLIMPGANYGWPEVEGGGDSSGGRSGAAEFTDPLVTWATDDASPSGAAIIGNTLYVAALRGERLWQVELDGNGGVVGEPTVRLDGLGRLRTVEAAPDGTLWVVTSNTDGRGAPTDDDDRILSIS